MKISERRLRKMIRNEIKNSVNEAGMGVKYPEIEVELTGSSGNAFSILGKIRGAMRRAGVPKEEIKDFVDEATSGDYNHVLQTAMRYVNVR